MDFGNWTVDGFVEDIMATKHTTQNPNNQRRGGRSWFRLLSALLAITLIASACGGSEDVADTAADAGAVVEEAVTGDSEESLVQSFDDDEEAMEDDEEAMEDAEEAMEDDSGDDSLTAAAPPIADDAPATCLLYTSDAADE